MSFDNNKKSKHGLNKRSQSFDKLAPFTEHRHYNSVNLYDDNDENNNLVCEDDNTIFVVTDETYYTDLNQQANFFDKDKNTDDGDGSAENIFSFPSVNPKKFSDDSKKFIDNQNSHSIYSPKSKNNNPKKIKLNIFSNITNNNSYNYNQYSNRPASARSNITSQNSDYRRFVQNNLQKLKVLFEQNQLFFYTILLPHDQNVNLQNNNTEDGQVALHFSLNSYQISSPTNNNNNSYRAHNHFNEKITAYRAYLADLNGLLFNIYTYAVHSSQKEKFTEFYNLLISFLENLIPNQNQGNQLPDFIAKRSPGSSINLHGLTKFNQNYSINDGIQTFKNLIAIQEKFRKRNTILSCVLKWIVLISKNKCLSVISSAILLELLQNKATNSHIGLHDSRFEIVYGMSVLIDQVDRLHMPEKQDMAHITVENLVKILQYAPSQENFSLLKELLKFLTLKTGVDRNGIIKALKPDYSAAVFQIISILQQYYPGEYLPLCNTLMLQCNQDHALSNPNTILSHLRTILNHSQMFEEVDEKEEAVKIYLDHLLYAVETTAEAQNFFKNFIFRVPKLVQRFNYFSYVLIWLTTMILLFLIFLATTQFYSIPALLIFCAVHAVILSLLLKDQNQYRLEIACQIKLYQGEKLTGYLLIFALIMAQLFFYSVNCSASAAVMLAISVLPMVALGFYLIITLYYDLFKNFELIRQKDITPLEYLNLYSYRLLQIALITGVMIVASCPVSTLILATLIIGTVIAYCLLDYVNQRQTYAPNSVAMKVSALFYQPDLSDNNTQQLLINRQSSNLEINK